MRLKIMGIPLPLYLAIGFILSLAVALKAVPTNMIGALALMIFFGSLLELIGNKLPLVKDFLGGGPIIIIFGASATIYFWGTLPEIARIDTTIRTFMVSGGFLDFYIAALITGSILGMQRQLLITATMRYIPAILGGLLTSFALVMLVGSLIGYGFKESLSFIAIPIMGGGMGAGAVPLSEIFASQMGLDTSSVLSRMVPAVAMANAMAIGLGGLLNRLGKRYPSLTGEGQLMRKQSNTPAQEESSTELTISDYGIGILLATTFFIVGATINRFMPSIHGYAWMIICVALVKVFRLLPRHYELIAQRWYDFVAKNFTPALLLGIGIAYTNLGEILLAFNWQYILLVFFTVIGAVLGAGFVGWLLGFYPIEAALTAGLCMANMGGTGDVATLGAAHRMQLMPFSQISSRIGGAMVLLIATAVANLFF